MCPHKKQLSGPQNTGSRRGLLHSKELQRQNLKQSLTIALRRSREPSRNLPEFLTRGGLRSRTSRVRPCTDCAAFCTEESSRPIISSRTAASPYHAGSGPRRRPTG